jgi:hypothetical protein
MTDRQAEAATVEAIVRAVLAQPKAIADYAAGKQAALGFLVGQGLRAAVAALPEERPSWVEQLPTVELSTEPPYVREVAEERLAPPLGQIAREVIDHWEAHKTAAAQDGGYLASLLTFQRAMDDLAAALGEEQTC